MIVAYRESTILAFCSFALLITATAAAQEAAIVAPEEAKVFLCGGTLATWRGDTGEWVNAGNARGHPDDEKSLEALPGTGTVVNGPTGRTKHLFSKAEFGDVRAHIEFMVPKGSNSGVYFQGRYEIQVFDSWGVAEPKYSDCGGIYQRWDEKRDPKGYEGYAPQVNASRAPGEWQSFDVIFRAPRFDPEGKKTANARFVKVLHNGKLVHENVELNGPTRASAFHDEKPLGPLMLQGDHGPVAYRNIWIVPEQGGETVNPFFAMDTGTRDEQHTTPASQAQMLQELGYAGIDHTGTKGIPELLTELDQRGLRLFAIYTGVNIDGGEKQWEPGLEEAIAALKGRGTVLWLPLTSKKHAVSSPDGDADAALVLTQIAEKAAASGLRIALYPHTGFWVERVEDAVRVAKRVNRPDVGVTFNLCHWLRVDGEDFEARLEEALPHLFVVTINGADADGKGWDRLIQPLDSGTFPVAPLLAKLDALGYRGPIGLQGYGIGGDVRQNLSRSITAWQELTK